MAIDNSELRAILMAQQWERAKGELRAMIGMQGALYEQNTVRDYREVKAKIEQFIKDFEDEGLQE